MYRTCTFSVSFQRKRPKKSRTSSRLAGQPAVRDNDPSLQALRRAAKGWVEEHGHLPACDATEGAYDAKNGVPRGCAAETIRLGLIWRKKGAFSDVTGP